MNYKMPICFSFVLFTILAVSGTAYAVSSFSAEAETFFAGKCLPGAKGALAGICDLRERMIVLESESDQDLTGVVYDINGVRIGKLLNTYFEYTQNTTTDSVITDAGYLVSKTGGAAWPLSYSTFSLTWTEVFTDETCSGNPYLSYWDVQSLVPSIVPGYNAELENIYYLTQDTTEILGLSLRTVDLSSNGDCINLSEYGGRTYDVLNLIEYTPPFDIVDQWTVKFE